MEIHFGKFPAGRTRNSGTEVFFMFFKRTKCSRQRRIKKRIGFVPDRSCLRKVFIRSGFHLELDHAYFFFCYKQPNSNKTRSLIVFKRPNLTSSYKHMLFPRQHTTLERRFWTSCVDWVICGKHVINFFIPNYAI